MSPEGQQFLSLLLESCKQVTFKDLTRCTKVGCGDKSVKVLRKLAPNIRSRQDTVERITLAQLAVIGFVVKDNVRHAAYACDLLWVNAKTADCLGRWIKVLGHSQRLQFARF